MRQKYKEPQTKRAASALLIPLFCFSHNYLFLISSSEQGLSLQRQQCPERLEPLRNPVFSVRHKARSWL